jgi:hypothetical protein
MDEVALVAIEIRYKFHNAPQTAQRRAKHGTAEG